MPPKEVALDLAAFLDSSEAQKHIETTGVERKDLRALAECFLLVCYEDLGLKPALLDGEAMHEAVAHGMPRRLDPKDPRVESVPGVLAAFLNHLEATEVVTQAYEIRQALADSTGELLEIVRSGQNALERVATKVDPFVHGAPKLGRNDPCFCGSGRKFKKCHGKGS